MLTSQLDFSSWFNCGYWRENTSMNIVWYMIMAFARWSNMSNLYLIYFHVTNTRGTLYSVTKCSFRTYSLYSLVYIFVTGQWPTQSVNDALQLCDTVTNKTVFMKIIGHIRHFWWLDPNVWWESSQIWIEYIKPIRQMSDESWKFFGYTDKMGVITSTSYPQHRPYHARSLVFLSTSATIDPSHRCGHHQAACREPAGSYDKTTGAAICFEHKTQYLLIRAPYTRIVVFWHISNIPPMISQSQISCYTPMFCIAAIFVKYCYTTGSWLL